MGICKLCLGSSMGLVWSHQTGLRTVSIPPNEENADQSCKCLVSLLVLGLDLLYGFGAVYGDLWRNRVYVDL